MEARNWPRNVVGMAWPERFNRIESMASQRGREDDLQKWTSQSATQHVAALPVRARVPCIQRAHAIHNKPHNSTELAGKHFKWSTPRRPPKQETPKRNGMADGLCVWSRHNKTACGSAGERTDGLEAVSVGEMGAHKTYRKAQR